MRRAVVSFPKSGRTWLRLILDGLDVAVEYTHAGAAHRLAAHSDSLNTEAASQYDRIVFLHRDPRDTVVSGYHQVTKRLTNVYTGSMSDFVRDRHHGIEKVVRFNRMWLDLVHADSNMLSVRYEEMHADAGAVIARVLSHFGESRSSEQIHEAVEQNRFDVLQRREISGDFSAEYRKILGSPSSPDPNGLKVRRGRVGNYAVELEPADIDYCNRFL